MTDIWDELKPLFSGAPNVYPEVDIIDLTPQQHATCLNYLFNRARECSFQFRLRRDNKLAVIAPSPNVVIDAIQKEEVVGAMMFTFPPMPTIVVYAHYKDTLTISYGRDEWDAMTVLMFFDLLSQLVSLAPGARIVPDNVNFTYKQRRVFMKMWQAFHYENA